METGESLGESPPSVSESTAQNAPVSATANHRSPQLDHPIAGEFEHKPTNGEPRSQGVGKRADISGDSGIGGGDGEGSGGSGGGGFASLARKLTSKGKGEAKPQVDRVASEKQQNGCPDDLDLPLGSEAYSISSLQANGIDSTSRISVGPDAVSSQKAAAQSGMMGWQSFNSDVSTSAASTTSLDMLLNDRLMDPEEVLFNLGFGGPQPVAFVPSLARIPQRFLQSAASRAAGEDGTCDPHPGPGGISSPEECPGPGSGGGGGGGLSAVVQAMQQQQPLGQMGRKRTGGFCVSGVLFFPCHGYVDLAKLVHVYDIPLVFFNREGSKCYRRVRLRSIQAATTGEGSGVGDDGNAGLENAAAVERKKSNRKSKRTIRRRKTGGKSLHQSRSWIESVEEEEVEKVPETKAQNEKGVKEEAAISEKMKTNTTGEERSESNVTPSKVIGECEKKTTEPQTIQHLVLSTERASLHGGTRDELAPVDRNQESKCVLETKTSILSTEAIGKKENSSSIDSLSSEKSGKAGRKKFFDLSYVKMAAKKLGDVMSGKLHKSRMYDLSSTSASVETGHNLSSTIPKKTDNCGDKSKVTLKKMISESPETFNPKLGFSYNHLDGSSQRLERSDPGNLNSLTPALREKPLGQRGLLEPEFKQHAQTSSHPNLVTRLCMAPLLGGYVSKWSGSTKSGNVSPELANKLCSSDSAINRPSDDADCLSGSQMEMSPRCHSLEPDDRPVVEDMISPEVTHVVCDAPKLSDSRVHSCDTSIVCGINVTSCDSSPKFSFHPRLDSSIECSYRFSREIGDDYDNRNVTSLSSNPCKSYQLDPADLQKITLQPNSLAPIVQSSSNNLGRHEASGEKPVVGNMSNSPEAKSFAVNIDSQSQEFSSGTNFENFPRSPDVSNIDVVSFAQTNVVSCHSLLSLSSARKTGIKLEKAIDKRDTLEFKDNFKSKPNDKGVATKTITLVNDVSFNRLEPSDIAQCDIAIAGDSRKDSAVNDAVGGTTDIIDMLNHRELKNNMNNTTHETNDAYDAINEVEETDVAPAGSLGPEALIESGHGKVGSSDVMSMLAPDAGGMGYLLKLGLSEKEDEEDNSSEVSSEYGHSPEDRSYDFVQTEHDQEDQGSLAEMDDGDEDDDESEYEDEYEDEDDYVSESAEEVGDMAEDFNARDTNCKDIAKINHEDIEFDLEKGNGNLTRLTVTSGELVERKGAYDSCQQKFELLSPSPTQYLHSPNFSEPQQSSFTLPHTPPITTPFHFEQLTLAEKPTTFHLSLENLNIAAKSGGVEERNQKTSSQQRYTTPVEKQSFSPVTPEITLTDSDGFSLPKSFSSQNFHSLSSYCARSSSISCSVDKFPNLKEFEKSRDAKLLGSLPRLFSASSSSLSFNLSNYQHAGRMSPRFLRSASPTTALFLKLRKTAPLSSSYTGSFLQRSPSNDYNLSQGQRQRHSLTVDTLNSLRAIAHEHVKSVKPGSKNAVRNSENLAAGSKGPESETFENSSTTEKNETDTRDMTLANFSEDKEKVITEDVVITKPESLDSTGNTPTKNFPSKGVNTSFPSVDPDYDSFEAPISGQKTRNYDYGSLSDAKKRLQSFENSPPSPETSKQSTHIGLACRKRQERVTIDFDPRLPSKKFGTYSSFTSSPLPEDTPADFEAPTSKTPKQLPLDVSDRRQSLLMRRRTSTGCITARQSSIPALAFSSSAEWAWLLSSRRPSDDLDRLSAADQAEMDLSNVSTSSDEDSESDIEERRSGERWDEMFSRPSGSVIFGL